MATVGFKGLIDIMLSVHGEMLNIKRC